MNQLFLETLFALQLQIILNANPQFFPLLALSELLESREGIKSVYSVYFYFAILYILPFLKEINIKSAASSPPPPPIKTERLG